MFDPRLRGYLRLLVPTSCHTPANGLVHHVLRWEEAREARGVVFLLHGYMDAAGTWDLVAPTLADAGYRVFAPDMRGFGAGARVSAGGYYHFADYVLDVADLTQALAGSAPLFVVGHSMGGTVTTLFGGAFPERPRAIAVLEGVGPPETPAEFTPLRMRRWIEDVRRVRAGDPKPLSRADALARLAMNHPRVGPETLATRLEHLVRDVEGGVAWRYDPLHKTTSPVAFSAAVYREFAKRVSCPVLFVSGGATGFHPEDEEERLACFARLTRLTLPDAGHMLHWTRPVDLAVGLLDFLRGCAP